MKKKETKPALCPTCSGTGRDKPNETCPTCGGTGKAV